MSTRDDEGADTHTLEVNYGRATTGPVIAVTGGKGGTGTTVTTLGLAAALGGDALAADADWTLPNLHALARVGRSWPDGDGETPPERRAVRPADGRDLQTNGRPPAVLPAPPAPGDRDRGAVLRRLAGRDGPVVVDTPSGVGPSAVLPARVADGVVVTTTTCAPAVRGATKSAAVASAVGTPVVAVVVTRAARVPSPVAAQFDAPARAVPPATPPVLARDRVADAYERLASAVGVA